MNEKEMNELNNYFDSLDYELTNDMAKCEHFDWPTEYLMAKAKLEMLVAIRSKIAEIKKE